MRPEDNYPALPTPVKFLVRLIMALIRLFIVWPFRAMFLVSIVLVSVFIRRDINPYKVNALVSLVLNLFSKVA